MTENTYTTPSGTIQYWVNTDAQYASPQLIFLPGLTADHRLMVENGNRIVDGLRAVMRALKVENAGAAGVHFAVDYLTAATRAVLSGSGCSVKTTRGSSRRTRRFTPASRAAYA